MHCGLVPLPRLSSPSVTRKPLRSGCAVSAAPKGPRGVINTHVSTLLAATITINAVLSPLAVSPVVASPAAARFPQIGLQRFVQQGLAVADAPDVHADAPNTPADAQVQQNQQNQQQQQQWWQADADAWLELTSPAELTAYMNSTQAAPAWPYLSDTLTPKLKLIEFYASWCPACRAAAPGMAAVANDAQLRASCSFARANVDRVKPLMKQLGISKIPTAMLLTPDGQVLDTVRATGQVVRDAIVQHAAALSRETAGAVPAPPAPPAAAPEVPPPSAEEEVPSEVVLNGSSNNSNSSNNSSSSSSGGGGDISTPQGDGAACSSTPEPSCRSSLPPGIAAAIAGSNDSSSPAAANTDTAAAAALLAAKQQFLAQFGSSYGYQGWLEQHYQQEVGRRLAAGQHYLDYTGAALYPSSLLDAVHSDLLSHTYGNPHSLGAAAAGPGTAAAAAAGPAAAAGGTRVGPAAASEAVLEGAALAVLQHLNADPADYQVLFTRSATEALKLVGEMFPWSNGSSSSSSGSSSGSRETAITLDGRMLKRQLLDQQQQQQQQAASASSSSTGGSKFIYTRSNHNSVLGIGAYAAAAGAELMPMTDSQMEAWINSAQQQQQRNQPQQQQRNQLQQQQQQQGVSAEQAAGPPTYHLVAYPAQDNYAGLIYPLDWVRQVHAASSSSDRYLVLLDAAAYLPTHPLDLTAHPADFVAASFYKMFGYPTGLGALVLRTELVPQLNKVYFGGGSVALATPEGCWHVATCDPGAALSDGTPNYLGAAALQLAYNSWDSRGGVQAVEAHTQALSTWLYSQLSGLTHSKGAPLLEIYGKHAEQQQHMGQQQGQQLVQGSIFNFQVLQPDGTPISYSRIEREAAAAGLDLRSGCVCNPGACYDTLGLQAEEVQALAGLKEGCGEDMDSITVMRPLDAAGVLLGAGAAVMDGVSDAAAAAGDGGVAGDGVQQQLVAKQVPLGSVRASLGWASTFEDAYALVAFLEGYVE